MKIKYFKRYLAFCLSTSFFACSSAFASEQLLDNKTLGQKTCRKTKTGKDRRKMPKENKKIEGFPDYITRVYASGHHPGDMIASVSFPKELKDNLKATNDLKQELTNLKLEDLLPGEKYYPHFLASLLRLAIISSSKFKSTTNKQKNGYYLSFALRYPKGGINIQIKDKNQVFNKDDCVIEELRKKLCDLLNSEYEDEAGNKWSGKLLAYITAYMGYTRLGKGQAKLKLSQLFKLYNITSEYEINSMLDPLLEIVCSSGTAMVSKKTTPNDHISKAYKDFYNKVVDEIIGACNESSEGNNLSKNEDEKENENYEFVNLNEYKNNSSVSRENENYVANRTKFYPENKEHKTKICTCGHLNLSVAKYCAACGSKFIFFPYAFKSCDNCKCLSLKDTKFCNMCGSKFD